MTANSATVTQWERKEESVTKPPDNVSVRKVSPVTNATVVTLPTTDTPTAKPVLVMELESLLRNVTQLLDNAHVTETSPEEPATNAPPDSTTTRIVVDANA